MKPRASQDNAADASEDEDEVEEEEEEEEDDDEEDNEEKDKDDEKEEEEDEKEEEDGDSSGDSSEASSEEKPKETKVQLLPRDRSRSRSRNAKKDRRSRSKLKRQEKKSSWRANRRSSSSPKKRRSRSPRKSRDRRPRSALRSPRRSEKRERRKDDRKRCSSSSRKDRKKRSRSRSARYKKNDRKGSPRRSQHRRRSPSPLLKKGDSEKAVAKGSSEVPKTSPSTQSQLFNALESLEALLNDKAQDPKTKETKPQSTQQTSKPPLERPPLPRQPAKLAQPAQPKPAQPKQPVQAVPKPASLGLPKKPQVLDWRRRSAVETKPPQQDQRASDPGYDFALRAHAGQLAAALAAAQALHNPGNKEVSRKIAALLEQCPNLTDDALTSLRTLQSDEVIQVLTTLVSRRMDIKDASTWVIQVISGMNGSMPGGNSGGSTSGSGGGGGGGGGGSGGSSGGGGGGSTSQGTATNSAVVKEMLERHLPNLAVPAKYVLLQNSEADAIKIIQDHASFSGDASDSVCQAANLALQGACNMQLYPMGMDAFSMMNQMGCGMMGMMGMMDMMPGCFGGMMPGQMMSMGGCSGCGMMGCGGCGGNMCGAAANTGNAATTDNSNAITAATAEPESTAIPMLASPYVIPAGVQLVSENEELLDELRSLQIDEKVFQEVLKLPAQEAKFHLQKVQQRGEEVRNVSAYLTKVTANFWAQGPRVPLTEDVAEWAPEISEGLSRPEEGQPLPVQPEPATPDEGPSSLMGVAPLSKADAFRQADEPEASCPGLHLRFDPERDAAGHGE
ncbi:unnamed protein product [Durusdinium trenchii]|uniref:Uncharacterized protein n=2 Tax=Durusdinium trenchii TaxID=1381693 RepID=A0ABP0PLD7_9DINO